MFKDATGLIRESISIQGDKFEQIITAPEFAENFTVKGETLKNVPRPYDSGHPQANYLKNKSWYLEYFIADEMLVKPDQFIPEAVRIFRIMKPFNDFLNRALDGFKMPAR